MPTASRLEPPRFRLPPPIISQTAHGATILVIPIESATTISLAVVARAGSAGEPIGGISNLTSKLLLRGTHTMQHLQLTTALDILGATSTTIATHRSMGLTITGLPEHFEQLAVLAAQCILEPAFEESQFEDERAKTLASFPLLLSDSSYRARRIFDILRYGDHPYSRSNIGTPASIAALNVENIRQWYEQLLRTAPWYVIAIGHLDAESASKTLQRLFASLPSGDNNLPPPPPAPLSSAIGYGEGLLTEQVELRCGHVSVPLISPEYPAALLIATVFAGHFHSRLNMLLREQEGLTYGVYGGIIAGKRTGTFVIAGSTTPGNVARFLDLTLHQWKELATTPLTSNELYLARQYLYGSFWRSLETPESIAGLALELTLNNLPLDFHTHLLATLEMQTPESLLPMQEALFDPSRILIAAVGDLDTLANILTTYGPAQHVLLEEEQQ